MTYSSIHITFGRNVGTTPLDQKDWDEFILDVKVELTLFLADNELPNEAPVEVHHGIGKYNEVYEASAKVSTYFEGALPDTTKLKEAVAKVAFVYGQDSVAFAAGESELVFTGHGARV